MSKHGYLFMMIALIVVGFVAVFVYQNNNLDKLDEAENEVITTPSNSPVVSGDSNGMSDPYCVVRILDKEMKTSVKSNCSNGIWNQSLIFNEIFCLRY